MKIKINNEKVKDLAQELECGFDVYINPDSGETKTILNTDNYGGGNEEFWEEEYNEIENQWESYVLIEPPRSYEGFQFMESFLDKVRTTELRVQLTNALNKKKPFAHFKVIVESSEYREDWFAHKSECYYNYLVDNLAYNDIGVEE